MDLHTRTTTPAPAGHGADLEPGLDVVLQEEAPLSALPVRATGVTRVKLLPNDDRSAVTRTLSTAYVQVLTADPFRAKAEIRAQSGTVNVSYARNQPQAGDPNYESVGVGGVITVTARVMVWVAAASGTATVSIAQERLEHSQ